MPFIQWSRELCIDNAQIDEQHQHFIGLINDLYNALEVGAEWSIVDDTIAMLLAYAKYHFHSEEKLMEKVRYPHAQEHIIEHRKFEEIAHNLDLRTRSRENTLPLDLFEFLQDWLANHIARYDHDLGAHARKYGQRC